MPHGQYCPIPIFNIFFVKFNIYAKSQKCKRLEAKNKGVASVTLQNSYSTMIILTTDQKTNTIIEILGPVSLQLIPVVWTFFPFEHCNLFRVKDKIIKAFFSFNTNFNAMFILESQFLVYPTPCSLNLQHYAGLCMGEWLVFLFTLTVLYSNW